MPPTTGTLPTVQEAIVGIMSTVSPLGKDGTNTTQNFKFRSVEAAVAAIQPALVEHGVTITPKIVNVTPSDREGKEGRILRFVTTVIEFTITGPAGDSIVASMAGEAFDVADKALNKSISAAVKYFLFYTFWIPVATDDADADHYEAAPSRPAARPATAAAPQQRAASLEERVAGRVPAPREDNGELLSQGQSRNLYRLWHHVLEWDKPRYVQEIKLVTGVDTSDDRTLTMRQAGALISALKLRAGEEDEPRGAPGPPPEPEDFAFGEEPF